MSDKLLVQVWSNFPGNGADLRVFMAIAEAADDHGSVYCAMAPLAAAARITVATAQPAIQRLRRDRWIVASAILGRGRSLAYQINLAKLERSVRPDNDPDIPLCDAARAARTVRARRTKKHSSALAAEQGSPADNYPREIFRVRV